MILTPAAVSPQHVSYDLYTLKTRCWPWLGCLSTHLFSYIFLQSRDFNERYLVARGLFSWLPIVRFAYGCFQQTDWPRLVQFVAFSLLYILLCLLQPCPTLLVVGFERYRFVRFLVSLFFSKPVSRWITWHGIHRCVDPLKKPAARFYSWTTTGEKHFVEIFGGFT